MKHSFKFINSNSQEGFTLIELMVSMVLGLLISAAVMQVYLISTKTAGIQDSASQLVEDTAFNIPVLDKRVRLAGLGLATIIKDNEIGAGIVLTSANNAPKDSNKTLFDNLKNAKDLDKEGLPKNITINGEPVPITLLTHTGEQTNTGSKNEWTGASNYNLRSGQLTIQYRAPQDMYDCEGQLVLGPRRVTVGGVSEAIDGQVIIERFYLKAPNASEPTNLSLYCDAGKYITEVMDDYTEQSTAEKPLPNSVGFKTNNVIKDFGDTGAEIMSNVDYFDILLMTMKDKTLKSTAAGDNTVQYYTVSEYLKLPADSKPIIKGIKYALILRSNKAVLTDAAPATIDALGKKLTLKKDLSQNYTRTVIESNITLRNANQQNY